ncbi:YibE/F family protein [Elusimicrobiota bacterium]
MKIKIFTAFICLLACASGVKADSWAERPDADFHAHPLQDIAVSSRTCARGEIVDIIRPAERSQSGLVKVVLASGKHSGKTVYAKNFLRGSRSYVLDKKGINVVVSYHDKETPDDVLIEGYDRLGMMILLIMIFTGLVLLTGGRRSIYSLGALAAGIILVKFMLVPVILAGSSPVIYTMLIVSVLIILTMIGIAGVSWKSLIASVSAMSGLLAVLILGSVFYDLAHIYGFCLEEIQLLNFAAPLIKHKPVGFFRSLMLAVLILAASGMIMDMGISVASSVKEVAIHGDGSDFRKLLKAGLTVSGDIVSTMVNTLVIAFLGISMSRIMVKSLHITSYFQLVNSEFFHIEFYKTVFGIIGLLICALSAVVMGALIYGGGKIAGKKSGS